MAVSLFHGHRKSFWFLLFCTLPSGAWGDFEIRKASVSSAPVEFVNITVGNDPYNIDRQSKRIAERLEGCGIKVASLRVNNLAELTAKLSNLKLAESAPFVAVQAHGEPGFLQTVEQPIPIQPFLETVEKHSPNSQVLVDACYMGDCAGNCRTLKVSTTCQRDTKAPVFPFVLASIVKLMCSAKNNDCTEWHFADPKRTGIIRGEQVIEYLRNHPGDLASFGQGFYENDAGELEYHEKGKKLYDTFLEPKDSSVRSPEALRKRLLTSPFFREIKDFAKELTVGEAIRPYLLSCDKDGKKTSVSAAVIGHLLNRQRTQTMIEPLSKFERQGSFESQSRAESVAKKLWSDFPKRCSFLTPMSDTEHACTNCQLSPDPKEREGFPIKHPLGVNQSEVPQFVWTASSAEWISFMPQLKTLTLRAPQCSEQTVPHNANVGSDLPPSTIHNPPRPPVVPATRRPPFRIFRR